jgi:hypothetical protein
MKKKILFLALSFAFISSVRLAFATATVFTIKGEVWLGNTLVLRAYPPSAGDAVASRIKKLLANGIRPSEIHVERYGKSYALNISTLPLILATPFRARLNHTSPRALAFLWANRLKEAIAHGTYLITPSHLLIPYGEERTLSIAGRYPGTLSVEIENPAITRLVSNEIPLVFKGDKPGFTRVKISVGHLSAYTNIFVKQWAGVVPEKAMLTLTGNQIPSDFLKNAVVDLLEKKVVQMPNTSLLIQPAKRFIPPFLEAGQNLIFPVQVSVTGEGYLPVHKNVLMQIQNKPIHLPSPAFLAVSNNPESFRQPGILFDRFLPNAPTRIFFHHHNAANKPFLFSMQITNHGTQAVQVHVLEGKGGPDADEFQVGETAAYQFFSASLDNLGEIVQINPSETLTLEQVRIPPDQSISGIVLLTPLAPQAKLSLQAVVQDLNSSNTLLPPLNPEDKQKPVGIFSNPKVSIQANYTVGGHFAFVKIGKDDFLKDIESGMPDYGDYGIIYNVSFTFSNPTQIDQKAEIAFHPEGGEAAGVFVLDGKQILQVPPTPPFAFYPIYKTVLKPGETKVVTLQTLPIGGSFYPIDLVGEP